MITSKLPCCVLEVICQIFFVCSLFRSTVYVTIFLLGAEETQRMKTVSSNTPSAPTGAKPDCRTNETETPGAKSATVLSSKHHKTDASPSAPVQVPGRSFQRPIRPTQVEPNAPDLHSLSSAAKPRQQLLQQAPYRPQMPNMPQSRRSSFIFCII